MGVKEVGWALDQRGLKPAEKLVLVALADRLNHKRGNLCIPSITEVSERSECSVRTVIRHLATLKEKGLITARVRRRADGSRTTNTYELLMDEQGANLSHRLETGRAETPQDVGGQCANLSGPHDRALSRPHDTAVSQRTEPVLNPSSAAPPLVKGAAAEGGERGNDGEEELGALGLALNLAEQSARVRRTWPDSPMAEFFVRVTGGMDPAVVEAALDEIEASGEQDPTLDCFTKTRWLVEERHRVRRGQGVAT